MDGQGDPIARSKVFKVITGTNGSEPDLWIADDLIGMAVKIGAPPAKGAVGYDIVMAETHNEHLFPVAKVFSSFKED